MSLFGGVVIFVIIWMVVFFTVLPFNIKSQIENKQISKGTDPGAPADPHLFNKFLITSGISLIIFALIIILSYFELINLRQFFSK